MLRLRFIFSQTTAEEKSSFCKSFYILNLI